MSESAGNIKTQDHLKPALQSQLAKIKREEEEELWISGEELYTEGSSDEEDCRCESRSCRRTEHSTRHTSSANPSLERRKNSPIRTQVRAKSENPSDMGRSQTDGNAPKNLTNLKKAPAIKPSGLSPSNVQNAHLFSLENESTETSATNFSSEEDISENVEISWKAKRGTITLRSMSENAKMDVDKC